MQQSWLRDADKLTFIICHPLGHDIGAHTVEAGIHDTPARMLGEVNMFISTVEDDDPERPRVMGELELMIAEKGQQRRGHGKAALLTFLAYIANQEEEIVGQFLESKGILSPHSPHFSFLSAKIGKHNHRIVALFERLGFRKLSEQPNYWGEYELRRDALTKEALASLLEPALHDYMERTYTA